MWTRLLDWCKGHPVAPLAHLHVVLYTRRGCHLCEDAWRLLRAEQERYRFALSAEDVDADPELRERYDTLVPVVTVNGRERFRGGVNPVLLSRLLRAEAGRAV